VLLAFFDSKFWFFILGLVVPVFLKKWIELHLFGSLVSIFVLTLLVLSYYGWRIHTRNRSAASATEADRLAMRPTKEAELLVAASNQARAVVGNTVELHINPNLTSLKPLDTIGWPPTDVKLIIPPTAVRSFNSILNEVGGLRKDLRPPNGKKFGIASASFITYDSAEMPMFTFYQTDYYTERSVACALEQNALLRSKYAELDPEKNQVPSCASLQAVVLFKNEDLLCMWRDSRADAERNRWSFSFEEQLKEEDFDSPWDNAGSAEPLFRRAVVEEVFGTKNTSQQGISEAWQKCKEFLITHRLWGMFYEVATASFHLFGFYWLDLFPRELAEWHKQAKAEGWLGRDLEGKLFVLERTQQISLLETGSAVVSGLYDGELKAIGADDQLHRTSLYRLWRLSRTIGRQRSKDPLIGLNLTA
jgi:hypothetical protein